MFDRWWKHRFLFNFSFSLSAYCVFLIQPLVERKMGRFGTSLDSFNRANKYQITFNLNPTVIFCLLKCKWRSFQKAIKFYSINFSIKIRMKHMQMHCPSACRLSTKDNLHQQKNKNNDLDIRSGKRQNIQTKLR